MPRRTPSDKGALAFDLKADRKKHKISQVEAAKILCVTQPTVARWEKSGGMPHIYRVVWNIHWKQLEQANESKEHSNVESKVASTGRNRHSNVVDLRPRNVVERPKVTNDVVTSGSTSNRKRSAGRKSIDSIDTEDNGLRVTEECDCMQPNCEICNG